MNKQRTSNATRSKTVTTATRRNTAAKRTPAIGPDRIDSDRRIDEQTRRAMIAQAAYFRAERRGFASGGDVTDWLEAEREISRMLEG